MIGKIPGLFSATLLMVFLFGCSNQNPTVTTQSSDKARAVDAASQAEKLESETLPSTSEKGAVNGQLIIGLDADISSGSAKSGEAIRRGIELAMDQINAEGGLLGKELKLEIRDHRGNPDRGVDNIEEFAAMKNVLAVVGGVHTPVALKELPAIHKHKVVYLGPWAAGTPIVANGYDPNFVFRVSVRDEYAGGFLVEKALQRNLRKIGLLLERTGWGRSNEKAITEYLKSRGLAPVGVEWFNWGEKKMEIQISNLLKQDAHVILLVSNSLEGDEVVKTIAELPESKRLPIISHWGISAGDFFQSSHDALEKVDVSFIQSFSFLGPNINDKAKGLVERYVARYENCDSARDIFAPVGTAHAYEMVMMLAEAVNRADSADSEKVRDALEELIDYRGLIKNYPRPFRPDHHDALSVDDFILAKFDSNGVITPEGD